MSIGERILDYRKSENLSQREIAESIPVDRSLVTRWEKGLDPKPHHDVSLSRLNWKIALKIIDERSGGYISDLLDEIPNLDLHPAAIKESLEIELRELEKSLEALKMSKHIDREKRKKSAENVWMETKDVLDYAAVMLGVLEEEFGLDRQRLIKKHEMETKEGKR